MRIKTVQAFVLLALFSGCAVLHHVQVGEVDNRTDTNTVPFEVMVSETGISTEDVDRIARAANGGGNNAVSAIAAVVGLFQMGPRTGNPVYTERYAEKLIYQIYEKCPSGQISDLLSIRETRKYPVISDEIVKVTGVCHHSKTTAQAEGVDQ